MMNRQQQTRKKRTMRVRRKLKGFYAKPRLSVSKSNKHISAQVIDDEKGITVAGYSTQVRELREKGSSKETAKIVGAKIAELAKAKGIDAVMFDRGSLKYHGVVAELADGAREAGLKL